MGIVERDFDAFAGFALEQYFKRKFLESGRYTKVGAWWDRKGENEIDLVCQNEFDGNVDFYEVKTDSRRFDVAALRHKVDAFFVKHPEMRDGKHEMGCLSINDM